MLQNQRACQLVRSKTGCEPLALAVAWGARTAGRCAAGVLGAVKHQRFSDQQLETFAARAPGICPKPVCDAGKPCPLPPQDDAVDVSVIVPVVSRHGDLAALHAEYKAGLAAAGVDNAELAVAREDEVVVVQGPDGADLRGLLALARRPEAELALPLQRDALGVDTAKQ